MGLGEVGLPPKKPHIYLSDLNDVLRYVEKVAAAHHSSLSTSPSATSDPFSLISDLPLQSHSYFLPFRDSLRSPDPIFSLLSSLLHYAYTIDLADESIPEADEKGGGGEERAGRFALETAIFDLWSQLLHIPLFSAVKGTPTHFTLSSSTLDGQLYNSHRPTCYTISITEDEEEIQREVSFARSLSDWLKIKLDNNIQRCQWMLRTIRSIDSKIQTSSSPSSSSSSSPRSLKWCIDANTAWTPEIALKMLDEVLQPYLQSIYMVEQPFPVWGHGCSKEEEIEV